MGDNAIVNRGKRSLALDLKDRAQQVPCSNSLRALMRCLKACDRE